MSTTQENVVTAGQARRILEEILPRGATSDQVQSIIISGILSELVNVDWENFDRNLFCFNNGIPAFHVSQQAEIRIDYQVSIIKYWDCFNDSVKNDVEKWLAKVVFPDYSGLGFVEGRYAVIKCRRDMSNKWLDKYMSDGGFVHVNYIELLSFYDQAFEIANRYNQLWAVKEKIKHKNGSEFFPIWNKHSGRYSGSGLINMFNPDFFEYDFRARKGACIVVRYI